MDWGPDRLGVSSQAAFDDATMGLASVRAKMLGDTWGA